MSPRFGHIVLLEKEMTICIVMKRFFVFFCFIFCLFVLMNKIMDFFFVLFSIRVKISQINATHGIRGIFDDFFLIYFFS